jgi:large subunit ribosomal protein L22
MQQTYSTLTGTTTPGRNPQQEKARIRQVLNRPANKKLPVRRYEIGGKGKERVVAIYTVKPTAFSPDVKTRLQDDLKEAMGKDVTVVVENEAVAVAKNIRRSPLKVRHVLGLVRGKQVDEALAILQFTPNFAAEDILKVVQSAAANAENGWGAEPKELVISECFADKAAVMKRFRPGPMGRARPIQKFLSHITVVLSDAGEGR